MKIVDQFNSLKIVLALRQNKKMQKIITFALYLFFALSVSLIFSLEKMKPFNYIIICLWAVFSFIAVAYIVIYGKFKVHYYLLLSLAFIVLQILSWCLNGFKSFNLTGILLGIMSIIVFEIAIQDGINKKIFTQIILAATWFALCFFVIFYMKDILSYKFGTKLQIRFGNSNDIARALSYCFVINYAFGFIVEKRFIKPILFLLSILSMSLIFVIGSVSNLIVCLLTLLFVPIIISGKKGRIVFSIVSFGLIILFILSLKLPFMSYFNSRITGMITSFFGGTGKGDDSFVYRFRGAYYAFQLFLRRPFYGNGFDSVYRNYVIMAHNNIAEIASDFGIFALTIEEFFILYPLIKASFKKNQIEKYYSLIIIPCLFYMFFFQIFLVSFNSKIECILLPLCFAMLFSYRKKVIKNDYYRIDI